MKLSNLAFLVIIFFTLQSCVDNEAYFGSSGHGGNTPGTFSRLSDIIKHDNVPTDSLSFNPNEDAMVEGLFGTKIYIPANSCVLGSNALPDELFVVLREYPTLSKMALSNVQVENNQEMLVTGGNFWWKIVDAEGRDWDIAQPSEITAEQRVVLSMGTYAQQANYYTGNIISGGNQQVLNWNLSNNGMGFMNEQNTIFNYDGLQLKWANSGALYDYPGERTQFKASLNTNTGIVTGQEMVILIANDFPSVINLYTRQGQNFVTNANAIPTGLTGTLVGIALDADRNLLIGSTEITVAGDDEFAIDLAPGTVTSLSALLNQVTN